MQPHAKVKARSGYEMGLLPQLLSVVASFPIARAAVPHATQPGSDCLRHCVYKLVDDKGITYCSPRSGNILWVSSLTSRETKGGGASRAAPLTSPFVGLATPLSQPPRQLYSILANECMHGQGLITGWLRHLSLAAAACVAEIRCEKAVPKWHGTAVSP